MTFLVVFASVVLFLASTIHSVPLNGFADLEGVEYGNNVSIRQRRVTCDLLSPEIKIKGFGGKVNHRACVANCLSMGKVGGRCNDGICECRRTTVKNLRDTRCD